MDNNFYSYDPAFERERKIKAIQTLRRHGNLSGMGVLSFVGGSIVIAALLRILNLTGLILNDEVFAEVFDIMFTVLAIFIPFLFIMFKVSQYHLDKTFALNMPKDKKLALWTIPTGLLLCFAGDRFASIVSSLFSWFGIELTSSAATIPNSSAAIFLNILSAVIVAPLVEEFAMRAVVMQPLRKYGEGFAITMTALVFALMHQNMVQGIFAFIAGLVFGYICIITGSVWCSIAVHCLNNLVSELSMLINRSPEGATVVFYNFIMIVTAVLGICGIFMILRNKNRNKLKRCEMKNIMTKEKVTAFLFAPPMLIAIVIMLFNCIFRK